MTPTRKTFTYGDHTVELETGNIARQADGAVLARMDDTVVLVTAVGVQSDDGGRGFLPLTVNYQEKTYAAGKIPGGFFRREGRPSELETLTSRLIDRPLRPLFPKGFENEVQVIATVLSINPDIPADIPAMIGASAAMAISGIPFNGPLAGVRVGYVNEEFVLNPTRSQLSQSQLDLVVAGTENAVLMVESEAQVLPESVMLDAVMYGHEQLQTAIKAIQELADEAGKPRWDWQAPEEDAALKTAVADAATESLTGAYTTPDKTERRDQIQTIKTTVAEQLASDDDSTEDGWTTGDVSKAISKLEKTIVRERILSGEKRIDGRDTTTVRNLDVNVGVLPRTHGSSLFTRGETQALVTTTLGTDRDAQIIDALAGERKEGFMLHYNFPPFSVGEAGFIGSPKRREIGHGNLARRAIQAVLPNLLEYPYVIRVVSEITESNGSSSMATVCGTSLALMDAGVPTKAPVAGVAMGLVKEDERFTVLTDILGDEDHLGDMDFKVAGTEQGVTALQMDIKIEGINRDIMNQALAQAKDARLHILKAMDAVINKPRDAVSDWAPSIITMKIDPEKIRDVIGKGGAVIRTITEETGATIDIDNDGTIRIASVEGAAGREAQQRIELITAEVEVGQVYEGKVERILDFGAIVGFLPGRDGLVHISQICDERVENVSDKLAEGDVVKVKVLEVDRQGRIRLSMRAVEQEAAA